MLKKNHSTEDGVYVFTIMRSFFGTASSSTKNQPHGHFEKKTFVFHWQQENNICLCKISPWRLRKKKKREKRK